MQTIGRSFFLPISILPVAGLLLGIGASFSNLATVQQYGLESIMGSGTLLNHAFLLMSAVGVVVNGNAVQVVYGPIVSAIKPKLQHYMDQRRQAQKN